MAGSAKFILVVPAQPRWNVPADLAYCCRRCGEHFLNAAGMGRLVPIGGVFDCQLLYAGCPDAPPVDVETS